MKNDILIAEISGKRPGTSSQRSTERFITEYDKVIKEAGLEIRKKIGYTFVSDITGNDFFKNVAESFVIAKHELPTLLYVDKIKITDD